MNIYTVVGGRAGGWVLWEELGVWFERRKSSIEMSGHKASGHSPPQVLLVSRRRSDQPVLRRKGSFLAETLA